MAYDQKRKPVGTSVPKHEATPLPIQNVSVSHAGDLPVTNKKKQRGRG